MSKPKKHKGLGSIGEYVDAHPVISALIAVGVIVNIAAIGYALSLPKKA